MQLHATNGFSQFNASGRNIPAIFPPRRKESFNTRKKDIAFANRGLQNAKVVQWLIGDVANQVENKFNDTDARKDCPSLLDATV